MYPSFKCVWAYDSSGSDPMAVRSDKAMPGSLGTLVFKPSPHA